MFHLGVPEVITLFMLPLSLILAIFWIWMIVDCVTKEPTEGNNKLIWILVIVLVGWIGALIYYFARRPQRIAQTGA
jgi:hypothetical protein